MKLFRYLKSLFTPKKKEKAELPKGRDQMVPPTQTPQKSDTLEEIKMPQVVRSTLALPFKAKEHYIEKIPFVKDPDVPPLEMVPKGIVVHFTCSYNLKSTIEWFKKSFVDIHLLLDKNGELVQMVPFNRKAAHAGDSKWKGYSGLNSHFIGIEVINIGPLKKVSSNPDKYIDCYQRTWTGAVYQYLTPVLGFKYWEPFTVDQMDSLVNVCATLCQTYKFKPEMICGHHECSPGRKSDPGGSMTISMYEFRTLVEKEIKRRQLTVNLTKHSVVWISPNQVRRQSN